MKVIFIREYTSEGGATVLPGSVVELPDDMARKLIETGFVRERREPRAPTETKTREEQEFEYGRKPRDYARKGET